MTIKEICKVGKVYRLYKVILESGVIFAIDKRNSKKGTDWQLVESTADVGHLANRMAKWGLTKDHTAALALLNS